MELHNSFIKKQNGVSNTEKVQQLTKIENQENMTNYTLNPLNESKQVDKIEVFYKRTPTKEKNSVLDSLFELNINEIEQEKKNHKTVNKDFKVGENIDQITSFFLSMNNGKESNSLENSNVLMEYLNNIRADAWSEFKKMVMQYTNYLDKDPQKLSAQEQISVSLITKVLDLGDRVNFVHLFGKKVDPQLIEYILNHVQPVLDKIPYFNQIKSLFENGGAFNSPISGILQSAALETLQQFAQYILQSAQPAVTEAEIMNYYSNLKISNPIAASGLKLILKLKDNDEPNTREGRLFSLPFFGNGNSPPAARKSSPSYSNLKIDPYLLLAGIGAAALLTFVAYRIIVTTMRRKKRDIDLGFIYGSDSPEIVSYIWNMIDEGNDKYDYYSSSENLVNNINNQWKEFKNRKSGCVKCKLFEYLKDETTDNINNINSLIA